MMVGREVALRVDRKPTGQSQRRLPRSRALRVVNARGTDVVAGPRPHGACPARSSDSSASRATARPSCSRPSPASAPIAGGDHHHRQRERRAADRARAPRARARQHSRGSHRARGSRPAPVVAENLVATKLGDRALRPPRPARSQGDQRQRAEADRAVLDPRRRARAPPSARCRAATCRRWWWRANWPSSRRCCWSASRRAASIWAPRSSSGAPSPRRATRARRCC